MSPHISSELIRFLRRTLKEIDEDFPAHEDQPVVTALKRLLLLRLGELESADADKSNPVVEQFPVSPIG